MKQKYSSKDTSTNVLNAAYTQNTFQPGSVVLDYGGGRYDTNKDYMATKKVTLLVYDPFWRTPAHNKAVLERYKRTGGEIVCSNVLNVIYEDEVVEDIVRRISRLHKGHRVIFAIYEGDRSGRGKQTSKGYQRNQKASCYIPVISKYFSAVYKRGNMIYAYRDRRTIDYHPFAVFI